MTPFRKDACLGLPGSRKWRLPRAVVPRGRGDGSPEPERLQTPPTRHHKQTPPTPPTPPTSPTRHLRARRSEPRLASADGPRGAGRAGSLCRRLQEDPSSRPPGFQGHPNSSSLRASHGPCVSDIASLCRQLSAPPSSPEGPVVTQAHGRTQGALSSPRLWINNLNSIRDVNPAPPREQTQSRVPRIRSRQRRGPFLWGWHNTKDP